LKKVVSQSSELERQNHLIDTWSDARPRAPKSARPIFNQPEVYYGISIPLFFIGLVIGVVICWFAGVSAIWAFLLGMCVPFICAIVVPVCWVLFLEELRLSRYNREMQTTGWAMYDQELEKWLRSGEDKFGKWRNCNNHVGVTLDAERRWSS
jgi:Flp pilus assembly protein TadB